MKYEILYIHEADKDIVKVIYGFQIKDKLSALGFTFNGESKEWTAPLTQDLHKTLIANGLKMNRFIDKTKTSRSI